MFASNVTLHDKIFTVNAQHILEAKHMTGNLEECSPI